MQSDLRTVGAALRVNTEGAIKHAARIALAIDPRGAVAAVAICFRFIMAR